MLNFLRKLRRKETKGTKYVKYALGEIFLVVIGILIAFQVNNWNEERKQKIEETKLLQSIKVDFENTRAILKQLNVRRDQSLSNFNELIKARNSGNFINEMHIDTLLARAFFYPTYNGNTSSIAVVVNSGKINLLSSDVLKALLLSWPIQIENLIERELDIKTITDEEWLPFAESYTSVNDWFKYYNFPDIPSKNRDTGVSKDYKGLFNDRRFENTITKLELIYLTAKRRTLGLIQNTDSIINTIDEDLISR